MFWKFAVVIYMVFYAAIDSVLSDKTSKNRKVKGNNEISRLNAFHHVSIYQPESFVCGGSLISNEHILTAMHCLDVNDINKPIQVLAGSNTRFQSTESARAKYSAGIMDTDDPKKSKETDVAILKLEKPFSDKKIVAPVPLTDRETEVGEEVTVFVSGDSQERVRTFKGVVVKILKDLICVEPSSKVGGTAISGGYIGNNGGGIVNKQGQLIGVYYETFREITLSDTGKFCFKSLFQHKNILDKFIPNIKKKDKTLKNKIKKILTMMRMKKTE